MRLLHVIRARTIIGMALLALLVSLGTTLPAMAQGQSQKAQTQTWYVLVGYDSQNHTITGMDFLPDQIWIDAGDTVVWNVYSVEPHTVSFLPPGQKAGDFNFNDPMQTQPQGGSSYDGHSYYNSGLLAFFSPSTQYSLTFPVTGNFTYHCLIHNMMTGHVHVRSTGTPYPYTQAQYNQQAQQRGQQLVHDGQGLVAWAKGKSDSHHVTVGVTDGDAMVMLFIPGNITVHVGDTVKFIDRTPTDDPHTVTFGPPPQEFPPVTPYGDPSHFAGQPFNSGLLGTRTNWIDQTVGNVFDVTFEQAGTYQFYCDIHGGMIINVNVLA
jgi:plastocyanin